MPSRRSTASPCRCAKPLGVDEILTQAREATLTDQRTTFIVAARHDLGPLLPSQRVIVLTDTEMKAANARFGPHLPIRIRLFALDHEGARGYVIWSASCVGGALDLENSDGVWLVRTRSSWIT